MKQAEILKLQPRKRLRLRMRDNRKEAVKPLVVIGLVLPMPDNN